MKRKTALVRIDKDVKDDLKKHAKTVGVKLHFLMSNILRNHINQNWKAKP